MNQLRARAARFCPTCGAIRAGRSGKGVRGAREEAKAQRIRELLWDETDGFFYDRNARAGEPLTSRHAGWAGAINDSSEEIIRAFCIRGHRIQKGTCK